MNIDRVIWNNDVGTGITKVVFNSDTGGYVYHENHARKDGPWLDKEDSVKMAIAILDDNDYDAVKREPKLLPCPNTTCGLTDHLRVVYDRWGDDRAYFVYCDNCGYRSGCGVSETQARELHNRLVKGCQDGI